MLDGLPYLEEAALTTRSSPRLAAPRTVSLESITGLAGSDAKPPSGLESSQISIEKSQSKFGAHFARLEDLESQASEITSRTDQKARGTWEPTARPREMASKSFLDSMMSTSTAKSNDRLFHEQTIIGRSSGTWQPSPPPPKLLLSPSPRPAQVSLPRPGTALKNVSRIPWEPSPPPTHSRISSPAKADQRVVSSQPADPLTSTRSSDIIPIMNHATQAEPELLEEDFPALQPAQQPGPTTPSEYNTTKRAWEALSALTSSRPSSPGSRRNSLQSVVTSIASKTRSRQSSIVEPYSKLQTPTGDQSPALSPVASRAASPSVSPSLIRTMSGLSAAPAVSSPLANLNTGKQIRIVSKPVDEAKLRAEKALAEEKAIKKIKEEEAALAAKSMVRKSVPATSIKKSREQKTAEQREKAERRELESIVSSQPEESAPVVEVAPIIGRARKQKSKQPIAKASSGKFEKRSPSPEIDREQESNEHDGQVNTSTSTAATDAILALSNEVDLQSYRFFSPIPDFMNERRLLFSKEELAKGEELSQWSSYTGKETVEQLEKMLAAARKEMNETFKALEKCQRKNLRLARINVTSL